MPIGYDGSCLALFLNNMAALPCPHVDLSAISPGDVGFHGLGGDAYADVDILSFSFKPIGSTGGSPNKFGSSFEPGRSRARDKRTVVTGIRQELPQ